MMNYEIRLMHLEHIHAEVGLPEPFVWVHHEGWFVAGLIEGWIQDGFCAVDHLIVRPTAKRKFHTMMQMSRDATRAVHARGLDAVIKIRTSDKRFDALESWAKRCGYGPYARTDDFQWYINRKDTSSDGQV